MKKKLIYNFGVKQFLEATRQWQLFAYLNTDQRKETTIVLSSLKTPFSPKTHVNNNFVDASKEFDKP